MVGPTAAEPSESDQMAGPLTCDRGRQRNPVLGEASEGCADAPEGAVEAPSERSYTQIFAAAASPMVTLRPSRLKVMVPAYGATSVTVSAVPGRRPLSHRNFR